jgi:hypothetical protein
MCVWCGPTQEDGTEYAHLSGPRKTASRPALFVTQIKKVCGKEIVGCGSAALRLGGELRCKGLCIKSHLLDFFSVQPLCALCSKFAEVCFLEKVFDARHVGELDPELFGIFSAAETSENRRARTQRVFTWWGVS